MDFRSNSDIEFYPLFPLLLREREYEGEGMKRVGRGRGCLSTNLVTTRHLTQGESGFIGRQLAISVSGFVTYNQYLR